MPKMPDVAAAQAEWAQDRTCSWCGHPASHHTESSPRRCGSLGFDHPDNVSLHRIAVCDCPGLIATPVVKVLPS